jgi:capsule polysaccharide export protein KpsE/RkpR
MSATGVKRTKVVAETETLEPKLIYGAEQDWKEWQARRLVLLWSIRRVPLKLFALCAIASILIPFFIPNSYTATSQLMPPENMTSSNMAMLATLTAKAGPLGGITSDLLNVKTSSGLFIGVLTSENILEQMVTQFNLTKVYKVDDDEEAQAKLNGKTFIREDKNSGLIAISVTDHDPQRAAAMANAYVDKLNALLGQLSTSSAHKERVFLEERLKFVKQDLDQATNQLAKFSSSTDTLDPQQESKAMLDAAGNITAQLVASESQLQGLRQIYTDRHPRVRALNARVEQLRMELRKLGGAPETAGAGQETKQILDGATQPSSTAYPSIRTLPLLGAKYEDYYRNLKIQESVYELLTSQNELAKVQEAKEIPTIRVLDVAKPPRKKISPHRALLSVLGIFVSFGVATICWLLAMFWQEVDPRDPRLMVVHDLLGRARRQFPWSSSSNAKFDSGREVVSPLRKGQNGPDDKIFD